MALKPTDSAALIAKAESAFKREDYANTYKICSELMKGKTASVVVYMQCIASLKLRENTRGLVDELIPDTLLFAMALDNFSSQSTSQSQNIQNYIHEILFTLLTSLIASIQKNYPFKSPKRSFKNTFNGAQASIANLRKLKSYDFSRFSASLPVKLIDFVYETADKLIAHVTNSINITKDVTNNWLYEDETDDLYERIVNYKSIMAEADLDSGELETVTAPEAPIKMKKGEINDYISEISGDQSGEFALDEIDDINIMPPAEVQVNENYTGENEKVTVSQVLGKTTDSVKPTEKTAKTNTLSLTGKTQPIRQKDLKNKPQTKASAEVVSEIKNEFDGYSIVKEKTKDVFVMPEAFDDFTGSERKAGKKGKMQPIDLLIGILAIFFIIAVAYIIMYFL